MNRSIVISRYATALVKYVRECGQGDAVCAQAEAIGKVLHSLPDLRRKVSASDDVVPPSRKVQLLESALPGEIAPALDRFLALLSRNGRMALAEEILRDFTDRYRRASGVRKAHLRTVNPPSEQLLQRLKELVREKTGDDVRIETALDPGLIGGFVFDIDNYLLDASVKRQLEQIRQQFIDNNRRII